MFATLEYQKQAKLCQRVAFFESIGDNYMKSKDDNDFKTEKLSKCKHQNQRKKKVEEKLKIQKL